MEKRVRGRNIAGSLGIWAVCLLVLIWGVFAWKRAGIWEMLGRAAWLDYEAYLQKRIFCVTCGAVSRGEAQGDGRMAETATPEGNLWESAEKPAGEGGEEALEEESKEPQPQEQTAQPDGDGETAVGGFSPHEKVRDVTEQEYGTYEELVKNFYTIDASTMAGSNQLNAALFLEKDFTVDRETDGPQILIYHTHSQEGFSDSVAGDAETTIVGVGERLTEILTGDYGYRVLHHTGEYDKKTRDDAYSRALPEIEQILRDNPSIQVVIDLHRDEMPKEYRLVQELDGEPTARFMFFNGLSRTKQTGNLDYLYNVYQEDNLAFSFQMQKKAMEYYPDLTRKIYLKGYRYNMHVCPRTLLIELGAQNNTLQEAMNACGPLAHILDLVLGGKEAP